MAKRSPDITLNAFLDYIKDCNLQIACSAEPTSYADATAGVDLATVAMASGDFSESDDISGRKLVMAAKPGITVDHSGTATHIALCKSGDTTLRYITTCNPQSFVSGMTTDFPSWKISISDPV